MISFNFLIYQKIAMLYCDVIWW